jgi:hypothetical protein
LPGVSNRGDSRPQAKNRNVFIDEGPAVLAAICNALKPNSPYASTLISLEAHKKTAQLP